MNEMSKSHSALLCFGPRVHRSLAAAGPDFLCPGLGAMFQIIYYNRMPVPLGLDVEREGLMGEGRDGGWDGEWREMAALAHRAELAARS